MFSGILLFTACQAPGDGKIPFNEEKAREQIIPVSQGSRLSNNFVHLRDSVLPAQLRDSSFLSTRFNLPIGETFNRDAIIALLNAPGAAGVRVYLGTDENGLVRMVLMPVDAQQKDIITKLTGNSTAAKSAGQARTTTVEGESVENGQRPPPPYNALNP